MEPSNFAPARSRRTPLDRWFQLFAHVDEIDDAGDAPAVPAELDVFPDVGVADDARSERGHTLTAGLFEG